MEYFVDDFEAVDEAFQMDEVFQEEEVKSQSLFMRFLSSLITSNKQQEPDLLLTETEINEYENTYITVSSSGDPNFARMIRRRKRISRRQLGLLQ